MTLRNCLIATTNSNDPILIENNSFQEFDLILFNYKADDQDVILMQWENKGFRIKEVISKKTECKGELLHVLANEQLDYEYIAIWDHDIECTVQDINQLFALGQNYGWHWYQPSLTTNSFWSYTWTLEKSFPEYWIHNSHSVFTYCPFVEIMVPVFSGKFWKFLQPLLEQYCYISGYGLDNHWIPQSLACFDEIIFPVVVKSISVHHVKPVSPSDKKFSNQLTATEENILCENSKIAIIENVYKTDDPCVSVKCISLNTSDSGERKLQFNNSAKKHNLDFEFFPAIDARQWSYSDYPSWIKHRGRRVDWHERLKPGEVGVAASHKTLFEEAWNNQIDALIVFEDDAVIVNSIDTLQVPKDADLLMLSNRWRHNRKGEAVGGSCGTEGYLITRKGIRKMLQIMQHVNMPLDLIMIAHCESMIEDGHSLTTVRNDLNPLLKIYHHHIFCIENDRGYSTVK